MRNLKKILALVLALMMTVSLMVVASAANIDNYDDKEEISDKYAVAVEVLSGIGIYQGDGAGEDTFRPQDSLSRAEVAVLLYRLLTTDVDDSEVDELPTTQLFDDVPSDEWFTGYINYAYTNAWVQGNGDGTYSPEAAITGYELTTMLVRALGRDNNFNEIGGDNWTTDAAVLGEITGIFKGLGSEVVLSNAVTREQAAQMIFNALNANTWDETEWSGHYEVNTTTLGQEQLGLACNEDAQDAWGRPQTEWSTTAAGTVATFPETPVATYDEAISQCDVATDLDRDGTFKLDVYTNGVQAEDVSFRATSTTKTLGGQGTLIEVYSDRLVVIDTYLARVTKVNDTLADPAGHVIKEAHSDLVVWCTVEDRTTSMEMASTDYAVGDYILVNINKGVTNAAKKVQPVQVAESFVGAQTRIWTNEARHTINGESYYDAAHYLMDAADTDTVQYTWFLDQYGNVIGSAAIDRNSYAVLKSLIWKVGTPGYAEATLINMDGTEYTATVASIDGDSNTTATVDFAAWNDDNVSPELADRFAVFGNVSSDSKYNDMYLGYALYQVTTNDNGSVNLNGWTDVNGNDTWNHNANETIVDYHANATVDTTASAILRANGNVLVHLDDSTQFVVRTGTAATGYTYTTYTGTDELPQFVAGTVDVFFDGVHSANRIADVVYIKNANLEADFGDHLFVITENYYQIAGTSLYRMTVVVDGVEREIATTGRNVEFLADNVGKLFHVTWVQNSNNTRYGEVRTVDLVNETTNAERACNYLAQAITVGNGTIVCNGVSYNITDATVVSTVPGVSSYTDITKDVVDEYGVWVVSETAPYNVATTVYVGTKLSSDVTLTVTSPKGVESYNAATHTWTVDFNGVDTNDTLTYDAYTYAWIDSPTNDGFASVTDYVMNQNTTRTVTVYAEDGLAVQAYTVTLDWSVDAKDFIDYIADFANLETVLYNGTGLSYRDIDDAIANAQKLNYGTATSARLMVEGAAPTTSAITYRNFETTADIDTSLVTEDLKATGEIKAANAGEYLVIAFTDAEDTWYTVFQIEE